MGPTRSVVKSEKDLYLRLESRISPIARSTRKMTAPMSMVHENHGGARQGDSAAGAHEQAGTDGTADCDELDVAVA